MKRSTMVIGVAMAILCVPAAQTVASALGIGLVPTVVVADVAASVYANVSDAACGYASDYNPNDYSFSSMYVCAADDHVRLDYTADDSVEPPENRSGSTLWFSTYSCTRGVLVHADWGDYYSYDCDSDWYSGAIPEDAFNVDPLLAEGSIRTTVQTHAGTSCALDLALHTPNGPATGNGQWSYVDPSRSLSVSMGSWADAAAYSSGTMTGSACGTPIGTYSYAGVSRGAGLTVAVSASSTPANP